jgi:SAM-dependent methyltransferase
MRIYIPSNRVPPVVKRLGYKLIFRQRKVPKPDQFIGAVSGKRGIEIGGPSLFFDISLPIYREVGSLDGVNFSQRTIWEGDINDSSDFCYRKRILGRQLIAEATDIPMVETGSYDFVLSCHSLEHVANPLKAFREWKRILKPGGFLILAVPNKESNFDHRRPITTFAHLVSDDQSNIDERDLTHLPEILQLHDLGRDKAAGSFEKFQNRSLDNFLNRGLHHHVFDTELLKECLTSSGFNIVKMYSSNYDHLVLSQI